MQCIQRSISLQPLEPLSNFLDARSNIFDKRTRPNDLLSKSLNPRSKPSTRSCSPQKHHIVMLMRMTVLTDQSRCPDILPPWDHFGLNPLCTTDKPEILSKEKKNNCLWILNSGNKSWDMFFRIPFFLFMGKAMRLEFIFRYSKHVKSVNIWAYDVNSI